MSLPGQETPQVCKPPNGRRYLHWLAIAVVIFIIAAIFLFRGKVTDLRSYGYAGVFFISFIATATIVVPVPGVAAVFAGGGFLNPFLVALLAGIAEPLGELTGYLAGYGGEVVVKRTRLFHALCTWMRRHGHITIFLLSMIPNPFFDLAGIAAGAVEFPIWRFLLVCWVGKTIKSLGFALAGYWGIHWALDILQRFQ